jgi:hypothetical protein
MQRWLEISKKEQIAVARRALENGTAARGWTLKRVRSSFCDYL